MARIRTIKPEFFTSEDIVALSAFARLLYIALWCEADRDGRMQWKPRTFKMRYFPADNIDIVSLCDEILGAGLIQLYGDGLAFIPAFHKHQHINPRESQSLLPDPGEETTRDDASSTRDDASVTYREEGKGKEGVHTRQDATRESPPPVGFGEFWSAYPRKVGKGEAEKAWKVTKGVELKTILQAIERARATEQWRKDGGQFIPHPATWLRQKRWEDEPEATPRTAGNVCELMRGAV